MSPRKRAARVHGVFNIDKPGGMTSHDVVDAVRRLVHERRVGHAGTLDPMATGVLVVCVGQATRLIEFMVGHTKVYRFTIRLGEETDTYDAEGRVIRQMPVPPLTPERIRTTLQQFLGDIEQIPPRYAAVRYKGKRLYEWARAGIDVQPEPRRVTIYALELEAWSSPHLTLRVTCGAGTYVRSLAHDISQALGTVGHVVALRRLASGPFHVEDAVPLDTLLQAPDWRVYLLPMDIGLVDIPVVELTPVQVEDVRHGRPVRALAPGKQPGEWRRAYGNGELIAMLQWDTERHQWRPRKVFI